MLDNPTYYKEGLEYLRSQGVPVPKNMPAEYNPALVKFHYDTSGKRLDPLQEAQRQAQLALAALNRDKLETEKLKRQGVRSFLAGEGEQPGTGATAGAADTGTAPPAGRQATAPAEVETAVQEATRLYPQVRPALVRAIIAQESNFDRRAVSSAGAQGYMQLMPGTAKDMGVDDPFDATQNIRGGVRYFAQLLTRYGGDEAKALAAYNAGPGRVDAARGDLKALPQETQDYVPKVLQRAQGGGGATTPAASGRITELRQRIAALTQRARGASVSEGLEGGATQLRSEITDLQQEVRRLEDQAITERHRQEEIPRAVEKETATTRAKNVVERERQGQPMLPEDRRKFLTGLRSDIRQEPTFKTYQEVRNGYQNVEIGASRDSSEGDLALIYGIAKILDPGSVVRESEFATVAAAQGKLQQLLNTPKRFFEGDRLTPENRQQLLSMAHAIATEKLTTAQTELRSVYEPLAKEGNIAFGQLLPLADLKPLATTGSASPAAPKPGAVPLTPAQERLRQKYGG